MSYKTVNLKIFISGKWYKTYWIKQKKNLFRTGLALYKENENMIIANKNLCCQGYIMQKVNIKFHKTKHMKTNEKLLIDQSFSIKLFLDFS